MVEINNKIDDEQKKNEWTLFLLFSQQLYFYWSK